MNTWKKKIFVINRQDLATALEAAAKLLNHEEDNQSEEMIALAEHLRTLTDETTSFDIVDDAYSLIIHNVIRTRAVFNEIDL